MGLSANIFEVYGHALHLVQPQVHPLTVTRRVLEGYLAALTNLEVPPHKVYHNSHLPECGQADLRLPLYACPPPHRRALHACRDACKQYTMPSACTA